jgi:hypothetical protein
MKNDIGSAGGEKTNSSCTGVASRYAELGFYFPVDVLSEAETAALLDDLESAENALAGDAEKLGILSAYPDRVLPSFDQLTRHPVIIEQVSKILGPDLMVWSASIFDKAPKSEKIVSWHQDLTYWGLDSDDEVTVWVALTPVTQASGCMWFVPGSHKRQAVQHIDTFAENNLLSRGQEIAVEVNEGEGVPVELRPGQASMHHGHLFHSSGPNTTALRRTAPAIRYIKPAVRQAGGEKPLVAHVSGEDSFGHYEIAGTPADRLRKEDFERCRRDMEIRRKILYAGAKQQKGTRY